MTIASAASVDGASAASTYYASSTSISPSLVGGPLVVAVGNTAIRCTTGLMSVSPQPLTATALPATVNSPLVTANCVATFAGIPRAASIATPGPMTMTLGTANYAAALNILAGGLVATTGNCKITVSAASAVAGSLRDTTGAAPVLGVPATRLALNGSVPVTVATTGPGPLPCPTGTTAAIAADGSPVGGAATGMFSFGGSITEN